MAGGSSRTSSGARDGRTGPVTRLFIRYRERLRRLVLHRIDRRLSARVDPSDVLQETYIEASRRIRERSPALGPPSFEWLRFLTMQKLCDLHRHHLVAQARDARRERRIAASRGSRSDASGYEPAGRETSPSEAAARAERMGIVRTVLDRLDPKDREVLLLRHFRGLSHDEVARSLGIAVDAAKKRYIRALGRFKALLPDPCSL